MKKELIHELFEKFELACNIYEDVECWSARELQEILGYSKWENFLKVIDKAKKACESSGIPVHDHFPDIRKMIDLGKGAQREILDIALTRYACYLSCSKWRSGEKRNSFCPNLLCCPNQKAGND